MKKIWIIFLTTFFFFSPDGPSKANNSTDCYPFKNLAMAMGCTSPERAVRPEIVQKFFDQQTPFFTNYNELLGPLFNSYYQEGLPAINKEYFITGNTNDTKKAQIIFIGEKHDSWSNALYSFIYLNKLALERKQQPTKMILLREGNSFSSRDYTLDALLFKKTSHLFYSYNRTQKGHLVYNPFEWDQNRNQYTLQNSDYFKTLSQLLKGQWPQNVDMRFNFWDNMDLLLKGAPHVKRNEHMIEILKLLEAKGENLIIIEAGAFHVPSFKFISTFFKLNLKASDEAQFWSHCNMLYNRYRVNSPLTPNESKTITVGACSSVPVYNYIQNKKYITLTPSQIKN